MDTVNTKFGTATIELLKSGYYKLNFDQPVSINGRLKTKEWVVHPDKLEQIKL